MDRLTREITCKEEQFYNVCKLLPTIESSFDIGYSKDIKNKILVITCYESDASKVTALINYLNDEIIAK